MRISDWSSDVCSSDLIGEDFSRLLFGVGAVLALTLLVLWRYGLARIGQRYLGDSPFADLCIYDGVERSALSGAEAIDADAVGLDRKSVAEGKRVSVRVDLGGRRFINKKTTQ